MRTFISALLLSLSATTAIAQQSPTPADAPAQEPPVEYAVELLVFLRDTAPDGENWPSDVVRPEPREAIATVGGGLPPEFPPDLRLPVEGAMDTDSAAPAAMPAQSEALSLEQMAPATPSLPIQPLPSDYLKLNAEADALKRKGLEPVLHTAWKQVVGDRDNKDWLWLETEHLYGLVRISLGRYLHIDSRLLLLGEGTEAEPAQAILSTDHRRMRSGELHYLDHPGFGILVQIDRYEPPAAAAGTDAEPLSLESLDSLSGDGAKKKNGSPQGE